jgi:hypothetical protein
MFNYRSEDSRFSGLVSSPCFHKVSAMDCPTNTPLVRKLGIKVGHRVALLEEPAGFRQWLGELPAEIVVQTDADPDDDDRLDIILFFASSLAELRRRFTPLARCLAPAGGFWVCWPKKASGVATDLTEDVVRAVAVEAGLVDNKVCAVDATWSALRLVIRVKDRPKR